MILIAVSFVLFSATAMGDELKIIPSVAIKEEYNDNIIYTSADAKRDWITTIAPELKIRNKTERLDASVSGRIEDRFYVRNTYLNATDQFYEGTGAYAVTPKLNVSGRAFYSSDTRPDRDIETTGLALTSVRRVRQNYTASGDYRFSEKTTVSLSYDYLRDRYNSDLYSDLEANTFGLGFAYDLNRFAQSTQARADFGYARYSIPDLNVDNYQGTLGVQRALNEKWGFLVAGGARYTVSKSDLLIQSTEPHVQLKNDDRGWGMVGRFTLAYKGQSVSADMAASHDLSPASGRSGATKRTSFTFNTSRRLTYEFSATLSGGYYLNRSASGQYSTQKIDENALRISPGIRYEFNKDAMIEASYTYNWTKYNESNTEADRNLFQVRFRIERDLLR